MRTGQAKGGNSHQRSVLRGKLGQQGVAPLVPLVVERMEPAQTPWYDSGLVWGAIGIVITVVAAMKPDSRFLLFFVLPLMGVAAWATAKSRELVGQPWL